MAGLIQRVLSGVNPKRVGEQVDSWAAALSPAWGAKRSAAKLLDAQHRYLAAGYDAAKVNTQRRPRSGVTIAENGQLTQMELDEVRAWSQDVFRNNSVNSGFIRRAIDNIVGTGLTIVPKTTDSGFNSELKRSWHEHTRRGGGWEASGRWSIEEAERLTVMSTMRDGDILWYRSDEGWQAFEAGQVGTPHGYDTRSMVIKNGVQFDTMGRPSRYWVASYSKYGYIESSTARGLRADLCRLVGTQDWVSQCRSLPIYHNCLGRFEDLDRYLEAELLKNMGQSCVMAEMQSPFTNALDALDSRNPSDRDAAEADRVRKVKVGPGMVVQTRPGETFKLHTAQGLSAAFGEYLRSNLRILGFPIGLPLELALMDFTETNFAAAKMAVTQALLTHLYWRDMILVMQFLDAVYKDFVRDGANGVRVPDGLKGPANAYEIIPPDSGWIEPYREAMALNVGLDGGWDTITRIGRDEMRRTLDDILRERADEIVTAKKIALEKGIENDWKSILMGMTRDKAASVTDVPGDSAA